MIYVKLFENHSEYEDFTGSTEYIEPHVSLCKEENDVHYNMPPEEEYIEIGGVKWATMNIGANSVTDNGIYFQWGDAKGYTAEQCGSGAGQKYFGWEDYKYNNGATEPTDADMTKYNATDGKTVLDDEDDGVLVASRGVWRMPTLEEGQALLNNTTSAWTDNYEGSGVAGVIFTDKTDASKALFFPACGSCHNGNVENVGEMGMYWLKTLYTSRLINAMSIGFYIARADVGYPYRNNGLNIRGVLNK